MNGERRLMTSHKDTENTKFWTDAQLNTLRDLGSVELPGAGTDVLEVLSDRFPVA